MDQTVPPAAPVAIVTGGSRGIGAAIVRRLAADGYRVAFCYASNSNAAEEVSRSLPGSADTYHRIVDVKTADDVRGFVEDVRATFGEPDVLVVCAGITRDNPLVLMDDAEWGSVIDTNLTGAYNFCRAVTFPLMKRRSGSIVLMGSVAGVYGNATQTNYSASKAGVEGLGRSLAKELAGRGIRVNVVAPGFIDTDMTSALSEKVRTKAKAEIPAGRFGKPEDVAELVGFLVSDKATYITGQVISINGGLTL